MKSEETPITTATQKQAQSPATMSQKLSWLKSLLRDEALSAKSKNIATALFMCHNESSGRCNPSQAYLAEATGMWRAAVNVALKELLDAGWVGRQKTQGTSLYRLEIEKAEGEAAPEMSGNRNIRLSGHADIPLSGNRNIPLSAGPDIPLSAGPDREPSREPSNRTIQLNTEPADQAEPAAIEEPVAFSEAELAWLGEAGLAEDVDATNVQPATTLPPAANDVPPELCGVERFGKLEIPVATYREWETAFTHLDLRATILSRSKWAYRLSEERRLASLETELGKLNAGERNAALDRKAAAEAKTSAPPAPEPVSRFHIALDANGNAVSGNSPLAVRPEKTKSRFQI